METKFFQYAWRHSRRDQIIALLLVLASLPFYWWSLEIPKSIVNDAIQGRAFRADQPEARLFHYVLSLPEFLGGHSFVISDGVMLKQVPYLFALSFLFLALVLINGAFKYVVNTQKGVLGERMLRRLRFELFTRVMRFEPEDVRATKSAEVASMIKDEVEPIGGFFGEAFITPTFLATQAVTALAFILIQNPWLGAVALAVISTQAFVIPRLRREQIRLGREQQVESRRLAGRIGEMVDSAPALHIYGVGGFSRAEIGERLGVLFHIRLLLYRRKFAVKYLNNLLAQVTPFVFYTLGGYLALKGRLDIGQLVAIIAAYRDLPSPIKELIDWDQQRADVKVKYEQVVSQFSRDTLVVEDGKQKIEIPAAAPFTLIGLQVADRRGVVQLDRLSLTIDRPSHVALVGPPGSGRDIIPRVLGRQIAEYQGSATIGGHELNKLPDDAASRVIIYAGGDPFIMSGTIRENICFALQLTPPPPEPTDPADVEAWRGYREARSTGNPTVSPRADWIDYQLVGANGPDDLDRVIVAALRLVRGYDSIFQLGVSGRLGTHIDPKIAERLVAARGVIRERLADYGLESLVEQYHPDRFNMSASLGENFVFGVPTGQRNGVASLSKIPYIRSILEAESLTEPLLSIGLKMVETVAEVLSDLPPGHPFFERYSFIAPTEIEEIMRALEGGRMQGKTRKLPIELRHRLIGFALSYVEPRHRLDLVDETLKSRILRARRSFRKFLPSVAAERLEFYNPEKAIAAASISENLLFGRIAYGAAGANEKVSRIIDEVIREQDLEAFILRQGLDYEAGPGGRLLSAQQRTIIHLVRAVLRRPDVLILDSALVGLAPYDAEQVLESIRQKMAGRTLIATFPDRNGSDAFDRVIAFEGARVIEDRVTARSAGKAPVVELVKSDTVGSRGRLAEVGR
ncbi:ABC transporter ATP-binding protein/permease [Terrarubrum flagellatum]|uniref:ABC transporter ATP-binding protein/permease n=1 Tax=Terrirubrum flagellatum TaxID=2895980 RepID=UPI0031454E32